MSKFFNNLAFINLGMGNIEYGLQTISQTLVQREIGKTCYPLREDAIPILNDNIEQEFITYYEEGAQQPDE